MIGRISPVESVAAIGQVGARQGLPRPTTMPKGRPAASRRTRPAPTCSARSARPSTGEPGSTTPPRTIRRSCSAAVPPGGSASTAPAPDTAGPGRRRVVHRGRHPGPGAARARARHGRAGRLAGGRGVPAASTGTRRPSTPGPRRPRSTAVRRVLAATANPARAQRGQRVPAVGRARRQAGHQPRVHRAAARTGRGGAARRRGRRRQHDGDLGARAARRDRPAPVARARPGATSAPSSWPSRCCCRRSAGSAARCWVPGHRRLRRLPALGRRGPARGRWPAASARPCSSARSPASTRRCGRPGSPPPRPSPHRPNWTHDHGRVGVVEDPLAPIRP